MSIDPELLDRLLRLPTKDRAALAHKLLRSMDDTDETFNFDEAWAPEIKRRIEQIDRGEVELIDSDVAVEQISRWLRAIVKEW